jgi:hypothetical protein
MLSPFITLLIDGVSEVDKLLNVIINIVNMWTAILYTLCSLEFLMKNEAMRVVIASYGYRLEVYS